MSIPDTLNKKDDINQTQNLTDQVKTEQSDKNNILQNETKLSTETQKEQLKVDSKESKENKENLNPNESKENKEQNINKETKDVNNENKEQAAILENKDNTKDSNKNSNTNITTEEKKDDNKTEKSEEKKEESKVVNNDENNNKVQTDSNNNQNQAETQNNQNEVNVENKNLKKRNIKKDICVIHSIQNYIIRNNFQKLVKVALQIDDADFDENNKNEKFLKLVREKIGIEKFLALMIKSQRGLQKFFIRTRKPRREPHKSSMNYLSRLNNMNGINNSMNMDITSNMSNTYTYVSNANTNYTSNMTNSMNNTFNFFAKEDNSIKYKPKTEDLTNDIAMASMLNNKKQEDANDASNTNNEGGKNSKNVTPKKTKYKTKDKEMEEELRMKLAGKGNEMNPNGYDGGNRFNSPMNSMMMNFNPNLGLSVHLHKDERKNIFKYYMHHYGQDNSAAFYCSDKRCTGSAKYNIDSKKFEIVSEHSIPYNQHCYIFRPFPNDQRLFKEFEKRSFTEAQLFKQPNGRSNIYWYNN
jgi:hypothetical protein